MGIEMKMKDLENIQSFETSTEIGTCKATTNRV